MFLRLVILALMLMIAIGCGSTSTENPDSTQGESQPVVESPKAATAEATASWETVEDVVRALDKHTLSNKSEKAYDLVHADDGAQYDVSPGGYSLEFYVFKNKDDVSKGVAALESMMAEFGFTGSLNEVVEKNVLLLPDILVGPFDETQLELLLADLRD